MLEELADNLMERNGDRINILVELEADEDCRYPQSVEQHVFRILQQGCENALRHARASTITISGRLAAAWFDLKLADDGVGFEADEQLNLDELLARKHFGLAGMLERAELIGAVCKLASAPGAGTSIRLTWDAASSQGATA